MPKRRLCNNHFLHDRSLGAIERLGDLEGKRSVTEQVEAARCWRVADRVLLHPCRVDSGGLSNRAHRVGDGPALNIGTKGSSVSVRLAISSTHSRNAALRACSAASRDQVARWMHSGSATQLFTGSTRIESP